MLLFTIVPSQRKMQSDMKLYRNRSLAEASISSAIVKQKGNSYA